MKNEELLRWRSAKWRMRITLSRKRKGNPHCSLFYWCQIFAHLVPDVCTFGASSKHSSYCIVTLLWMVQIIFLNYSCMIFITHKNQYLPSHLPSPSLTLTLTLKTPINRGFSRVVWGCEGKITKKLFGSSQILVQGLSLLIKNAIRQTPELHFTYSNKCLLSLIYINVLNFEKSQLFYNLVLLILQVASPVILKLQVEMRIVFVLF